MRLFIRALWSPAGKGLTSWLSFVVSNCEFVTFPLVSWVRCGTWLYWFLIFAPLLTFSSRRLLFCNIFTAQPISQTTVYTAKEGDALDINCNATSTHNNEIYWEKNVSHNTFRQNGSHLNFVNITRDSAGGYVCYSKNLTAGSVNASIVRSIDINVLCKFCSITFHLLKNR